MAVDVLYNMVVVPVTGFDEGAAQRFLLSATRMDRGHRMVSPEWTEGEVRTAFAGAGLSLVQTEELLRGNRMVFGGRDARYLHFTAEQLLGMGLEAPGEESTP